MILTDCQSLADSAGSTTGGQAFILGAPRRAGPGLFRQRVRTPRGPWMCIFRRMSDAYDPRQELPPGPMITGAVIMFCLAIGVVGYITKWFSEATGASASAPVSAPANTPEAPPAADAGAAPAVKAEAH